MIIRLVMHIVYCNINNPQNNSIIALITISQKNVENKNINDLIPVSYLMSQLKLRLSKINQKKKLEQLNLHAQIPNEVSQKNRAILAILTWSLFFFANMGLFSISAGVVVVL